MYQWFVLNRGPLSVLIHPLTINEVLDHTERAVWMGNPLPLNIDSLQHTLDRVPLQYPHLKLGYSAAWKELCKSMIQMQRVEEVEGYQ